VLCEINISSVFAIPNKLLLPSHDMMSRMIAHAALVAAAHASDLRLPPGTSFTRAAEELCVTQGAVSQQVRTRSRTRPQAVQS
jgi:hypothetical protein